MITKENQHLLEILADILHDKVPKPITAEEWVTIRNELNSQGVLSLIAINCNTLQLDSDSQAFMRAQLNATMHKFYDIMETQSAVVSALEEAGIPVTVLKGSAAAMNYPVPELRLMGDIDILVPKDRFEEAFHILNSKDYECENDLKDYYRHIGFKTKNGIEIELHQYFASNDESEKCKKLNAYIFKALEKVEHIEINGYMTPVLPTVANGMVLLAHLNHHLQEGIGLRHVIDWMCFVERHLDDKLWNEEFSSVAEQMGLVKLAKETTAMCQKYLGLTKEITWCGFPNELSDKYNEYVLRQGNYAIKQEEREKKVIKVIRIFRNPFKALSTAQKYGLQNWKQLSDYPWLKPFAWAYQIVRWVRLGLESKVGINTMQKAIKKTKTDNSVLDELDLIEK